MASRSTRFLQKACKGPLARGVSKPGIQPCRFSALCVSIKRMSASHPRESRAEDGHGLEMWLSARTVLAHQL